MVQARGLGTVKGSAQEDDFPKNGWQDAMMETINMLINQNRLSDEYSKKLQ